MYLDVSVRRVDCPTCGRVKQERLDWLAHNPHYTKRFAWYVGHRCRSASIHEVAQELRLDWHAVKAMEMEYMQAQLDAVGPPTPRVIGIDEISIRKGHVYRIIVSDLERAQPIWFGGTDRGEASMTMFYDFLGMAETAALRLAVMDMWKPFRKATRAQAPHVADSLRQVSCAAAIGERTRPRTKVRIPALDQSSGSPFHQRTKVRAVVASRKFVTREARFPRHATRREQSLEHRLLTERAIRATLGLSERHVGAKILRGVAPVPALAAAAVVRKVCGLD